MINKYRLCRKVLDFRPDSVLTAGMLEELDNFPHEILRLFYQDYCDGIVTGLDFRDENGRIWLTPGLVRFQGNFYSLAEPVSLSDIMDDYLRQTGRSGKLSYLVLEPGPAENVRGVPTEYLMLVPSPEPDANAAMQIASFGDGITHLLPDIAVKNKKIKDSADDMAESFLSRALIYVLDTPVAAIGAPAFHPLVFRAARNLLRAKQRKSAADLNLLFMLAQKPGLSLLAMRCYIESCGGQWPENISDRRQIIREFFRCLGLEDAITVSMTSAKSSPSQKNEIRDMSIWL